MRSKSDKFKVEQIIKYMGNKRNIISHVVRGIMKIHDPTKSFCDLMAGTSSVGYALKTLKGTDIEIVSNDVQVYSYIISKTLIQNNSKSSINKLDAEKDLLEKFQENINLLDKSYSEKYIKGNQYRTRKINRSFIEKIRNNTPFCLFTFYYSDIFFSIAQSKEIDSLRYAISKVTDGIKKNIYLSCLLYAVSYGSYSFGHFAQPRRKTKEYRKISKKSILELFFRKLKTMDIGFNNSKNTIFQKNYKDLFLDKKFIKMANSIGTIYLDPPYSPAHYSRFYHLLETLIEYDYPENRFKGLYREDRFKSDFCSKLLIEGAFRKVVKFSFENNCNLVLSYSNTGLLTKRQIKSICREYYPNKNVWSEKDVNHIHSTQGNRKKNGVKEILILCKY